MEQTFSLSQQLYFNACSSTRIVFVNDVYKTFWVFSSSLKLLGIVPFLCLVGAVKTVVVCAIEDELWLELVFFVFFPLLF